MMNKEVEDEIREAGALMAVDGLGYLWLPGDGLLNGGVRQDVEKLFRLEVLDHDADHYYVKAQYRHLFKQI